MGILGNLMDKIFGRKEAVAQTPNVNSTPNVQTSVNTPVQGFDVQSHLNGLAKNNPEKLNWQTSIVDLMKLVGMDSSLNHRKELAKELNFTGDINDSASMNIWLHKQVMKKISENGGKLPADLH